MESRVTLLGGAGIALTGYLLAVAGFCATAGGAGLGTTAMAKGILRRQLLKKVEESLKDRSLPELLEMSSAERNG